VFPISQTLFEEGVHAVVTHLKATNSPVRLRESVNATLSANDAASATGRRVLLFFGDVHEPADDVLSSHYRDLHIQRIWDISHPKFMILLFEVLFDRTAIRPC
jgi:hypothetical protein